MSPTSRRRLVSRRGRGRFPLSFLLKDSGDGDKRTGNTHRSSATSQYLIEALILPIVLCKLLKTTDVLFPQNRRVDLRGRSASRRSNRIYNFLSLVFSAHKKREAVCGRELNRKCSVWEGAKQEVQCVGGC